jgi:hypothetical protein
MMTIDKSDDLKIKSDNILSLLHENKELLEKKEDSNLYIYIFVAIASMLLSYAISDKYFLELSFIIVGIALILSFLIIKFTMILIEHTIDASILFIDDLSSKKWLFSTINASEKWQEWQAIYPFINKGDMNDSIALRIYGNYENFSFCYFEYDYTIETQEEVKHEDLDAEIHYETEYYYDDYTESGIIIYKRNHLPYIETSASLAYSNALKFSYIDLNARMSAYSSKPHEAITFFNPTMQRKFAKFYSEFPSSSISIDKEHIFINFGADLLSLSRSIKFDDRLYQRIKRSNVSDKIEYIMQALLPILKGIN